MPVTEDALLYDVCARVVLRGGVMYRDVFENNLPGAVWIHCGILGLLGNSSEATRLFDLTVFALIVVLLVLWLARAGTPRPVLVWTAVLLWLFYSSTSEWCHCQRDTWMLLPVLAALHLRRRQLSRLTHQEIPASRAFLWAVTEGVLWGVAVWIKPFVLVPAAAASLVGVAATRRQLGASRRGATDFAGLLTGGLLAGGAGLAWLYASGAWPYFWDIMLHWNSGYYSRQSLARRLLFESVRARRFFPWSLVHVPALFVAAVSILRVVRTSTSKSVSESSVAMALLAALYLGWEVQAVFLQFDFDYIHSPALLLAVALVAGQAVPQLRPRVAWIALALFLAIAAVRHPLLQSGRRENWTRCWREGSSPELRNRLSSSRLRTESVDWVALARTADYLRDRARPGELTCFSQQTVDIYKELELTPATRYVYVDVNLYFLPGREAEVMSVLDRSGQRFVVTDVESSLLPYIDAGRLPPEGEQLIPYEELSRHQHEFPWSVPIVFRAGRYVVHQVRTSDPEGKQP
jgi:hypothetical protein